LVRGVDADVGYDGGGAVDGFELYSSLRQSPVLNIQIPLSPPVPHPLKENGTSKNEKTGEPRKITHLLDSNIFPIPRLHQILLPIDELQMTVFIPFPNITGFEPSILCNRLFRLLRVVVIPAGDICAADPDLALVVARVVVGFGVGDELDVAAGGDGAEGVRGPF
jgi:hypothetical protein